jgi:peptidylprolyl isomerase
MKTCAIALVAALAAILLGCGGNEETATSADTAFNDRTPANATQGNGNPDFPLPKIPADSPPLKKLVIKDLKVGKGPLARWGNEAIARYVGVYWKTGKVFTEALEPEPLGFKLELNGPAPGWQKGLHGMRVGGWRELLIPSDLLYDGGDGAYIVTLVRVKPGTAS